MRNHASWDELGIDALTDRRREKRKTIAIPIEVTGFGIDGRFFAERTVTDDISESGCSFRLTKRLDRGGIVAIKVLSEEQKQARDDGTFLHQIAYSSQDATGWVTGAAKMREESLWTIAASPETVNSGGPPEPS